MTTRWISVVASALVLGWDLVEWEQVELRLEPEQLQLSVHERRQLRKRDL